MTTASPHTIPTTLSVVITIARREMVDSLRDWRIIFPIIILTTFFPFLMDFTSRMATTWVTQFNEGNIIIAERLNPFLLMIVGFFPISFSLIIALESFVGEKERNSIEPLLSMPVSDLALYLGKMLSSLLPPLLASYLGIAVFLLMRRFTNPPWIPDTELFLLMVLLTTMKALVMVSGAVVVSSQTTSVRASNLLASFIIIPMAFLLQVESVIMFYADYAGLWWVLLALLVVDMILIRMGIRIFNREEILSKEMDELSFRSLWRSFIGYLFRPPELAADHQNHLAAKFDLRRFYVHDIPYLLREYALAFAVVALSLVGSVGLGWYYTSIYPLPADLIPLDQVTEDTFERFSDAQAVRIINTPFIFFNNLRVVAVAGLLSIFSFGVLVLLLVLLNGTIVSFILTQVVQAGYNPFYFLIAFILPHGIFEITALIIGFAFAFRIGASLISPPHGLDVGQALLLTSANFFKVIILVVVPLLLIGAMVEANITPRLVVWLYAT